MSIKELFFSSFIQGIGKTTGTVTILGFLGCAWYIQMNYLKVKVQEQVQEQEQEQVQQVQQVQEQGQVQVQGQEQLDLEQIEYLKSPLRSATFTPLEYNTQRQRESNYKKIFEKLL